jgi:hypothetical protein
MVFAINSDESGARNFAAFQALAKQLNASSSTSTGGGSSGGGSSGAGVVNGVAAGSVVALVAGFIGLLL